MGLKQNGYNATGLDDYAAMQAQIITGYLSIADELSLRVAPAGVAWQETLATDPSLSASTVRHMQHVAQAIVLGNRARWHIPPFTDGVTPR